MATAPVDLEHQPFFLESAEGEPEILYSAYDMRRFISSIYASTGIIGHRSFYTTQADIVGWRILVKQGYARVGNYIVHSPTEQTISIAHFATSPSDIRTHKVWVVVYDKGHSGSEYKARILVTEDEGMGAPVPNAAAFIQIAQVKIGPGQPNIQKANINVTYHHASPMDDPLPCDPAPGFADAGIDTAPFATREGGGVVRFSGAVKRSNNTPFVGGNAYQLTTVTGTQWPKYTRYAQASLSVSTGTGYGTTLACRLSIAPDGSVTAYIPNGTSPDYILLDGATYELD